MELKVKVGVSARHIHLNQDDFEKLFGKNAELHIKKYIGQPGQFAAEEQITLVTNKGSISKIRVIGPLRKNTQIELSITDVRTLGLNVAVKNSGDTSDSPGGHLIGVKGEMNIDEGIIVAARHLHLCKETAQINKLKDGDIVFVKTVGIRSLVFNNVLVRVGETHADEFHIDTDEANASGLNNEDIVSVIDYDQHGILQQARNILRYVVDKEELGYTGS